MQLKSRDSVMPWIFIDNKMNFSLLALHKIGQANQSLKGF